MGDGPPGTVALTINADNDAPVAYDGSVNINEDGVVAITLVADDVDLDTLTFPSVTDPPFGTVAGTPPNITYTPDPGFTGKGLLGDTDYD